MTLVAITGPVGLATGCGGSDNGGDSGKDAKEMQAVLVKSLTVNDPQVECVETVTKNFVSTIYKSLATCKTVEAKPETDPATGATLTDVKVDGDKATATATVKGGDTAGATGELTFAKEDGAWKVDDLGVSFLRSTLETGLSRSKEAPFNNAATRTCLLDGMTKLSDSEFKAIAYDSIGGRDNAQFLKLISGCLADTSSSSSSTSTSTDSSAATSDENVSGLRKKFEEGITESAKADGKSQAEIDCIVKSLRGSISDDDIIAQIGKAKGDIDPKVTKATANAIIDCTK